MTGALLPPPTDDPPAGLSAGYVIAAAPVSCAAAPPTLDPSASDTDQHPNPGTRHKHQGTRVARHAVLSGPTATTAPATLLNSGVLLPLTSVETVSKQGPHPELVTSSASQRPDNDGTTRPDQLLGIRQRAAWLVPSPRFATRTPASHRPRSPEPLPTLGDQLNTISPTEASGVGRIQVRGLADERRHASLPVRSPGAHLHPLLRRPPAARLSGAGDSAR